MRFLHKIQERLQLVALTVGSEQKNIERLFARVFGGEDGQKVLAYLHHITTSRIMAPDSSEEQLRHVEGQRYLLQTIEKLANRGRKE